MRAFAAVEVGQLFEVAWVSLAAGVAVSALFSVVVLCGARSADAQRNGRAGAAALFAGLAVVSFAVFAVGVGLGVHIMLTKD